MGQTILLYIRKCVDNIVSFFRYIQLYNSSSRGVGNVPNIMHKYLCKYSVYSAVYRVDNPFFHWITC